MKILAIDDNLDNLTALQAIMQEVLPACTLVTALNGPHGLERALAEDPDVILLDIIMPGMDGYEVCRQLKGDARLRLIPVIFLTAAGTDRASRIQALDCGAEGFIAKPLDGLVLVAEVRAMAKIKAAALLQQDEARRLSELVVERTQALRLSSRSLLNTLEDVRAENEARKAAQAAAQSAHALSSTIIDSIPGCFYMLDENGCYVRWNTYQRDVIVGKPDDQIAGMNALDTIHPEDRAAIQAKIAGVLQNGTVESVEGRVLLHGGPDFIWMLMTGRGIVVAGRPFLVGTGIDITARRQAELAKLESALMLEGVVNAMPVRVFWKDRNLVYQGCNRVFAHDAGFATPEELLGKDDFQMGWREQAEAYRDDDRTVIDSGCPKLLIEEPQTTPDGKDITLLTSKLPMRNAQGEITGVLGAYLDITDRKLALQALEESELRFRTLFDRANDGIFLLDREGRLVAANQSLARMHGYSVAEMCQMQLRDLDTPDTAQKAPERMARLLAGENLSFEVEHYHKDGHIIPLEVTGSVVSIGGESLIQCFHRDISERKRAEDALRQKDLQFQKLSAMLPDLLFQFTRRPDGSYCMPNASAGIRNIFGCAPEDVREDFAPIARVLFPEDAARVMREIEESAQRSTAFACEFRVQIPGRETQWIYSRSQPEKLPDGSVTWCGICTDITEFKRLDTYREMGRVVLQILNEPGELPAIIQRVSATLKIWTEFDAVGLRLQDGMDFPYAAQDGFPEAFLQAENSLLSRGADGGVCPGKDGQACLECTCGLVLSGKTDPTQPFCTKGGSFWTNDSLPLLDLAPGQDPRHHPRNTCIHHGYASVALVPIRAKDRIVGLIQLNDRRKDRFTRATVVLLETIAAHIGEAMIRKQVEAEHAKLQEQFVQAQKMESVGRLAGGVAHDFNNLLMGMMGYVELCRDAIDASHPSRAWLDEIMVCAKKSADITRQLLAFARKQVVRPRRLVLNDAVASMTKLLRRLIGEDIALTWAPGPDMGPVLIDPTQVDQILANLCVNARDAISGNGRITLKSGRRTIDPVRSATHPGAGPGEYMYLSVNDNGCGIAADMIDRIFEPFYTTKGEGHGTGLGLATVYGIVTQNRGFIDVESAPGRGSTFTIYLPEAAGELMAAADANAEEMPRGQGQTILVVEDDRSVMVPLCLTLKALGYNILAAGNPREALKMVNQQPCAIQLVLTDVVMPGASGLQLAEQLHATRPDLKIVFMSGYTADSPALRDVLNKGGDLLAKPFSRGSLARKLHEVLDGAAGGACLLK